MKTKLFALIAFTLIAIIGFGKNSVSPVAYQQHNPVPVVDNDETHQTSTSLFTFYKGASEINVSKDIRNAVFLEINFTELARIYSLRSPLLKLTIPASPMGNFTFDLHNAKILTDNFIVTNQKNEKINYTPGLYYQGDVSGYSPSLSAFSMFDNIVMAVFSCNKANYVLGLWKDKSNVHNNIYILYNDNDVLYPREFACDFDALPQPTRSSSDEGPHLQTSNCIKVYFECDFHMFTDMGSAVNVTNFVTGMFNVIKAVYNNETVDVEISQVYVWTASDPYLPGVTSSDLLNSFQATRTTFNGDVAHLLTTRPLAAGGLAYLNILCSPGSAYAMSNIDNTYDPYPNTCWTTMVVAHELGHNFGSNHTQWCGWPGGAIDDCVPTEGGCPPGATPPTGGGTIMSYCHIGSGSGTLLTNGFGPLPGNAVRAAYAAASCLTACASPPSPQFSNAPISSCTAPATVTFIDQTLGAVVSWTWDVDNDGTIDYTTASPTHTYTALGTYTVKLTATNPNGTNAIIKTNYITIGPVTPAVSATVSFGSSSTCQSSFVTFTATPTNGGPNPQYQWYLNGVALPGETGVLYIENGFSTNDVITCGLVSDELCASPTTAMSNPITLTVAPVLTPAITISITAGATNICAGEPVTYSAVTINGGITPVYQWRVNSVNVGTNSATFTTSTLLNSDAVTCVLTTSETCVSSPAVSSNIIVMTVHPDVPPIVSISVTSGTNPTCSSDPITFTAVSVLGGTTPIYQWKKNGVNTVIGNSYTLTAPLTGDIITCTLTSNAPCISIIPIINNI